MVKRIDKVQSSSFYTAMPKLSYSAKTSCISHTPLLLPDIGDHTVSFKVVAQTTQTKPSRYLSLIQFSNPSNHALSSQKKLSWYLNNIIFDHYPGILVHPNLILHNSFFLDMCSSLAFTCFYSFLSTQTIIPGSCGDFKYHENKLGR